MFHQSVNLIYTSQKFVQQNKSMIFIFVDRKIFFLTIQRALSYSFCILNTPALHRVQKSAFF